MERKNEEIEDTIRAAMVKYGIPLDKYIYRKSISGNEKIHCRK